ncbi:MAG: hypothetical protein PVJ50_09285 [Desulfobacterales bacterium]
MAKRIGYFFPERVGLFVELSEAVAFGEVLDFYYDVIGHGSTRRAHSAWRRGHGALRVAPRLNSPQLNK